jgi:hypothetical protein
LTWLLWTLLQAQLWSFFRVSPFLLGEEHFGGTGLVASCTNHALLTVIG